MTGENEEIWVARECRLENGLPVFTRFCRDLPVESKLKKLNILIVVSWQYESEDETGLPSDEVLDQMEEFENVMDESLVDKGTARLMTVFTGEGLREWQFYTDDAEIFMRKFNEALKGKRVLPLEIEALEDENWDAYKDFTEIGKDE